LVGQGTELSRLGGGIGTRGPGETKLESDRRHIRKRIDDIKQQLKVVVEHRKRYRERRKKNEMFHISLVGYTNAGKSTL
ncbi:GTPase HflX, partial [Pseudomonas sp. FW305-BF6]